MPTWDDLSFVDHYLLHNSRYESPNSFWRWSAYGAIASVLRDNVYRRMGDNKLFPNVYILSLAESSFHRKGRPIEFSESLVREVKNTKVISGRASIQAITFELSRTETDSKSGKLIKGGSAVFYAPEMAAGLVQDPAAISILTDIYEPKPHYDTLLKTQAKSTITNLVFSMIAASNEDLLKSVYDTSALRGGLLARTFLIVPDEFRPPASLMEFTEEQYHEISCSRKCLLAKLQKIATLAGEVIVTKEAAYTYKAWYEPFRKNHESTKDRSGMLGRIHTGIIKLAMILAANDNDLIITEKHISKAIDDCIALVPNYNKLSMGAGNSSIKDAGALVLNDLIEAPGYKLSRRQIFQKHLLEFDSLTFDSLIVTLETAGLLQQTIGMSSTDYALTAKGIEILKGEK